MTDVVLTRRERDVHRFNHRGKRPGIFGASIDAATGTELDRQAAVFGVKRERYRARWIPFMFITESDERLRRRVFLTYQKQSAPGPCVHNVWIGYDTGTKCDDCGEWLCWLDQSAARDVVRLTTETVEERKVRVASGGAR